MDWIRNMQRAIDYMEANLDSDLDFAEIAKQAYSSSFHFQRIFSLLTGMTLGEYIRSRRLTMAGAELSMSESKVLDIALKYGYDSPESFAKAFTRFHGISPSAAKEPGARLKSFSRLSIKVILEGGDIMDYRIVNKQPFHVAAKVKSFTTKDEINKTEIPQFWTQCHKDGSIAGLCEMAKKEGPFETGKALLGICDSRCCPDDADLFQYAIGIETDKTSVPEGYSLIEIPELTWAVFKCVGAMPQAVQKMWKRIYSEFFPQSDYEPLQGMDFELYPEGDLNNADYGSEIWISVKKKA